MTNTDKYRESRKIVEDIAKGGDILISELEKLKRYQRIYPCDIKRLYPTCYEKIMIYLKAYKWCIICKSYYPKADKKCKKTECNKILKEKQRVAYEKSKATLKAKYGSETYNNVEKSKETHLKKYGKVGYNNREKYKQTCIEKFGCDNPFGNADIISKGKQTRLEKYGSETFVNAEKNRQTKLERYGDPNYNNRQKFLKTMAENGIWEIRTQKNINTSLKKYGTKSHKQSHFKNYENIDNLEVYSQFKSVQDCEKYFNVSYTTARNLILKFNPELCKNKCLSEDIFATHIQTKNKIIRSRKIIPPKELDIYLPENNLAIEYNGLLFHSQGISEHAIFNTPNFDKNYHLQKTLECKNRGIQLFHIFEGENIDLWLSMINNKLGLNARIYARNCYAEELRNSDCKTFLEENHLQGFSNASIAIGLYAGKNSTKVQDMQDIERKLVAVMTFGKPRFTKGYDYELIRFCSLKGYNIIGGASKLWKFFLKKYNPKSVISYANLRFSNGGLYEKLGFSLKNQSAPNYFYFHPKDGKLYPRIKFQKHKLSKLLDVFDENKSEVENMFANGYRRIYDCGNLVYEWSCK